MTPPVIAALAAGACCLLAFDACCLTRLARYRASMPKWTWALIICASFPLGGLLYLAFGKVDEPLESPPSGAVWR